MIGMIHPNYYNRALRACDVTNVTVFEQDGAMRCEMGEGGQAEMVNALTVAYTKLLAAESQISLLRDVRNTLNAFGEVEIEDARDTVDAIIANLTGISVEP